MFTKVLFTISVPLNPPPPNQQNDGCPLEVLLKGLETELRTLSQNCEQTLQKLRTNRIMNKRVFLSKARDFGRSTPLNLGVWAYRVFWRYPAWRQPNPPPPRFKYQKLQQLEDLQSGSLCRSKLAVFISTSTPARAASAP